MHDMMDGGMMWGMMAAGLLILALIIDACLTPVRPLKPTEIRALREREGASQAVFAR